MKADNNASTTNQELSLYITTTGGVRIGSSSNYLNLIPDGFQITLPTAATYLVEHKKCVVKAPENLKVSTVGSNAVKTIFPGRFLEFYDVSIHNDIVAVCWASNSVTFPDHLAMDQSVSIGKVIYNDGCPQLQMGPPIVTVRNDGVGFAVEQGISINPTNTLNIAAVTLNTTSPIIYKGLVSRTFDGGLNWTTSQIDDTIFTENIGRGDWNIAVDKYGNFWFFGMYVIGPNPRDNANRFIGFAVSSDGGQTFQEVGKLIPLPDNISDYPRISFGGDGNGGYGAWVSCLEISPDFLQSEINVGVFTINGLGDIEPIIQHRQNNLSFDNTAPRTGAQFASEILTTDEGKVYLISTPWDYSPDGFLYISVKEPGTPFGEDSFGPSKLISQSNVGYNPSQNVIYNGSRGIFQQSYRFVYDENKKRIYIGVINQEPFKSQDMSINLIYSDDDGSTWHKHGPISDTNEGNRGTLNMGKDEVTGNILFSWFDARGDLTNESINLFAAVMDPSKKPKLIKNPEAKCCKKNLKPILNPPQLQSLEREVKVNSTNEWETKLIELYGVEHNSLTENVKMNSRRRKKMEYKKKLEESKL